MKTMTGPTSDVRRPTSKTCCGGALIGVTMSLLLAACTPSRTDAPSSEQPSAAAAPQTLAFPEDAFRVKQPPAAATTPFAQPRLDSFALENGIRVHLVERHALPTVTVELVIEGGGIDDPPGKEGLASLSLALMGEGTQALDKLAFREALADLASNVSTYANADQLGVSMSSLTRCVDATLDLWADTLLHPGLRQAEFDRLVRSRLINLEQISGAPQRIAARLRDPVAWGSDHPYGRIYTVASTTAITLEDCRDYIAHHLASANATLYVVGDITEAQVRERIAPRLAGLQGQGAPEPVPGPPTPREGRIFLVDKPGSAQSMVSVLEPGPARTAPDYVPTSIMSAILGGGFSGRINMNIRERNGYAYGAFGGFQYQRTASVFNAGGAIRADVTVEAIHEIVTEITRMREAPVTDVELAREIDGAVLAVPARFATGSDILGTYRGLIFFGLPIDYYESYAAEVTRVDRDAVLAAAQKYLDPAQLRILVVGDRATLLPKLTAFARDELNDARVTVLDLDGKPIEP